LTVLFLLNRPLFPNKADYYHEKLNSKVRD